MKMFLRVLLACLAVCISGQKPLPQPSLQRSAAPTSKSTSLEARALRDNLKRMYRLNEASCATQGGVSILMGLYAASAMSSDKDKVNGSSPRFTLWYEHPVHGSGKLETG